MKQTLKKICMKVPPLRLLWKGFSNVKNLGFSATWRKCVKKVKQTKVYQKAKKKYEYNPRRLRKQQKRKFDADIRFSIIVPLYNTHEKYLEDMIKSVIAQTFQTWQLCLGDGSDADNTKVQIICEKYIKKDKRIEYRRFDKNEGISGNSNKCLEMATGNYIALLDHDDILHQSALYEAAAVIERFDADFIYTDENTFNETISDAFQPHYKQDFAPDNLRAINYICHLTVFKASLLEKTGRFRRDYDGAQDHDLILRLTEQADKIVHIPKILYYWRAHKASTAADPESKGYTHLAGKRAIVDHLERVGLAGTVEDSPLANTHRIKYEINGEPCISIIIPNKDHIDILDKCLKSIKTLSTYKNYEIIIVENNSENNETYEYYKSIENKDNIRVVFWNGIFNFSAINNYGAGFANGEYLLLLNNDIEIISADWMQEMLMYAQRPDVGAVGAKLYYPDDTIQHAGVILGVGGVGGHAHKYFKRDAYGYMNRLIYAQNLSAVTAACMMIPKALFDELGGLDERFVVAFNDVDLCQRIRKAGYLIVFTPYAEMYHHESKSRGYEDTEEKKARFKSEIDLYQSLWLKEIEAGDPYYNPNLTLKHEDFSEC
ncbi:MAG: glycosyltransferase family 2 protein [Oscillospiraceae bacterium]|nr:glycosyltransferase family 2 protein [Oscillospiraceae bacterium]